MTDITMPKLSESMQQGTILSWLKADGERIEAGDELAEIEADKATVTYAVETAGILAIRAREGSSLPVGALIAQIDDGVPVTDDPAPSATPTASVQSAPERASLEPVREVKISRATPLARRTAAIHKVALDTLEGSGPLGRITRRDVIAAAGITEAPSQVRTPSTRSGRVNHAGATPSRADTGGKGAVEIIEPTRLQAVVAQRMTESKTSIPHFQVQVDVEMDAAVTLRARFKETGADVVPSFNDLIVKASALALRAHPNANGSFSGGRFERYKRVNVGVAVATEDALLVPTIFDADEKSLGTIASEARRLVGKVRDGSIAHAELAGATFTVSNLGMYGMTAITPVIDVPQAAILGVGAMRETLRRVEGEIIDRILMTLTLSCDHRILYGADAARFLASIRQLLEEPLRLAL